MLHEKPEILAPVGSAEMLYAAVRAGADAVYLGLDDFNARRNAENFTIDTLKNAVEFCHIRGVKVYLTFNILILDSELEKALELAVRAAKCGIDAIITSDLGFSSLLKKTIPSLPIHASTQMTIHSVASLRKIYEMGFSRVVVSREMSKTELSEFCKRANEFGIEVEVFVHGALCMSMSGQCLLSAMLGGRSGNRGLCAGPCRLPFSTEKGTGYDLSLKDQSLIPYLDELSEMGVKSFKIEGRMKRPEYVAAAVSACRSMVDKGYVPQSLDTALESVFSRSGFTDGYYTSNLGKDMFGIRTKDDVKATSDILSSLHELYRNERQSVPLFADVKIVENSNITLSISDWQNYVTVKGMMPEKAISRPIDEETVREKISKTGGTPYYIEKINIELEEGLSVRVSELNELRRNAIEKLDKLRASVENIEVLSVTLKGKNKPVKSPISTVIRIENSEQLTKRVKDSDLVVIPVEISPLKFDISDITFAVDMPRGIFNEKFILKQLEKWKSVGAKAAFCGTISAMNLAKEVGLAIVCDFGMNIYNTETADSLSADAVAGVLSAELLLTDAIKIGGGLKKGIISYGKLPLMLTRNCPIKNGYDCAECEKNNTLTDRKNIKFGVRCRNGCSEVLNSKPIWLADRKDEMLGLDFEVLYFTDETPERVDSVIAAFENLIKPDCEYTRGLYYRGVE